MSQRDESGDGGQRVSREYPPGSGDSGEARADDRAVRQNPPVMEEQATRPASEMSGERGAGTARDNRVIETGRGERGAETGREERDLRGTRRTEPAVVEGRAGVRARYGGFDWLATFLGFAVAIFFLLVLLGVVGAVVGSVASQIGATGLNSDGSVPGTTQSLGLGAVIGSAVAVLLAYFIGGYAAGRLARYDGVANGIGVVGWTVLVTVILGVLGAVLGSKFNVASQLHLNVSPGSLKAGGVVALVVTVVLMLVGSALGGSLGTRYHRRVDRAAGIEA